VRESGRWGEGEKESERKRESGRWREGKRGRVKESERIGEMGRVKEREIYIEREWENQGERKAPCLAFKLIRTIDI